jgi:hypothetical protein
MHRKTSVFTLVLLLATFACSKAPTDQQSSSATDSSTDSNSTSSSNLFASQDPVVAAGTTITVRLQQAVGSKISNNGDTFEATVANPVEADGKVVIPAGSPATGHVIEAAPEGRFKGGAVLRVALDSVTINGSRYNLRTTSVSRTIKGKGKRTAVMVGGGAGAGALIGGLAGGGKGALIGAALGAGAGTAGAAYTGNKNIVLPAESALSFKLTQKITVKQ